MILSVVSWVYSCNLEWQSGKTLGGRTDCVFMRIIMNDISQAVFYINWYQFAKTLSDDPEKQLRFYNMVFDYSFAGIEPPKDDELYAIFIFVKPNIDASLKKRMAGKKGGEKKGEAHRKRAEAQNDRDMFTECPPDFMPQDTAYASRSPENHPEENSAEDSKKTYSEKESIGNPVENSFFGQKKVLYSNVNEDEDEDEDDVSPPSSPGIRTENSPGTASDYLNPPEPLKPDLLLSQHQQRYAQIIFQKFRNAGLPCRNGSYWDFLQSDFKNALPALKGIHSNAVLKACDNYISELGKNESILKQKYNFEMFVNSKNFCKCLPENYFPENFTDYSFSRKNRLKDAEEKKKAAEKRDEERRRKSMLKSCCYCGASLSDIFGNARNLFCKSCKKEFQLDPHTMKWEELK